MTAYVISDLHLAPGHGPALMAFERFLDSFPVPGDSLYVLGDLFEYWAGDDDLDAPFNRHVVDRFAACAARGAALFWIPGNRDFLAGEAFAEAARMLPLAEPFIFDLHGVRTALLHGDTLCTDDRPYQAFRAEARSERWRREFLGRPLTERRADIEAMRERSEREKAAKPAAIMDVNDAAVARLFADSGATQLIHGHTHRPGRHDYMMLGRHATRWVLPAWEDAPGGLRIDSHGAAFIEFN